MRWVTLTNGTGTTFHSANTLLVAGNPNTGGGSPVYRGRPMPPPPPRPDGRMVPGTETADREQLGDFYLYPIAERTTIANNQTKRSASSTRSVPARKVYGRTVGWLSSDPQPVNVQSQIAFSSSRDGGLGDALPAGTVRFYQRDRAGNPQFIGENGIGHTPMGSELTLTTGDAFDVFVQAEVESRDRITSADYERSSRYRVTINGEQVREVQIDRTVDYWRTTMRYTLTNAKSTPVDVELVQGGLDYGWWTNDFRVVSEDVPGTQLNADRKYVVTVPAQWPARGSRHLRTRY